MKQAIEKYLEYLRVVRNSSPHTILNYGKDLEQFLTFLSPPGAQPPLAAVKHTLIREFVGHLHDQGLEKSSVARKLAALRSFFKYCVREGLVAENPARLVPTPKLPKRIPSILSAEEMNGFLNHVATMGPASAAGAVSIERPMGSHDAPKRPRRDDAGLLLRRDRALLELLYAAGLRVSELTGLNLIDIDPSECMLRVRGKGDKERIVPYGSKAQEALEKYWPSASSCLRTSPGSLATHRCPMRKPSSSTMRAGASRSARSAASSRNTCVW
jgi:integrase/recombinase XerC